MKKTFLLICLAAGLLSCAKELTPQEETPAGVPMNFEINIAGTKASTSGWTEGDVVYVFFKGIAEKYLTLTYDGSSWDNASTLTDEDFADLSDRTLAAVHIPVPVVMASLPGAKAVIFSTDDGSEPSSYYLYDNGEAYTVDGTTVSASISLNKPNGIVLFHIPGIQDNLSAYTFSSPQIKAGGCMGVINDSAQGYFIDLDTPLGGVADEDGAVFAGWLDTDEAKDYTFTLVGPDKTYTLTRSNKALEEGKMYNFPALDSGDWTVTTDYQYVDLGLPSGTLWATMNVGASSPEDYGDYFAWGEIAPKEAYAWSTLKYWNPNIGKPTKYTGTDYSYLQAEDDAAAANWGGDWHMPTDADWQELLDNCYVFKADSYGETGVAGVYVVSKEDMDKSIFLPANGMMNDMGLQAVGTGGYYWSSSLVESTPGTAFQLSYTLNASGSTQTIARGSRYTGCAVRPVIGGADPGSTGTIGGHKFVDMGDGIKWATMNLGATAPEESGDHFAWGETASKTSYTWGNYVLASIPVDETNPDENGWWYINRYTCEDETFSFDFENPSSSWHTAWYNMEIEYGDEGEVSFYAEYNGDNAVSLSDSDDAAQVKWGSSWHTPGWYEFESLLDNCDYEFVENYNGSRSNGWLFTSKINRNRLFFPAAGVFKSGEPVGYKTQGGYWINEVNHIDPNTKEAIQFAFDTSSIEIDFADRYLGLSIRPVSY